MNNSKTDILWETCINSSQIDWQKVAETMREHAQALEEQNSKLLCIILNNIEQATADSPDIKTLINKYLDDADLNKEL